MNVRINISDDVVVDGEIPEPRPGVDIPLMGVRLGWMWAAAGDDDAFDGVVEWSRADERDGLIETVFSVSTFRVLTQEAGRGPRPEAGDRVALRGSLSCMRSYEFDDLDLPDIRQSWRVTAVLSRDRDGYVIERNRSLRPGRMATARPHVCDIARATPLP